MAYDWFFDTITQGCKADVLKIGKDNQKMVTLYDIDALQKRNAELEAENGVLRAALLAVDEWNETDGEYHYCTWCGSNKKYGHASDCPRQLALGLTEVKK